MCDWEQLLPPTYEKLVWELEYQGVVDRVLGARLSSYSDTCTGVTAYKSCS